LLGKRRRRRRRRRERERDREREKKRRKKERKEITILHDDTGTFVAGSVPPSPSSPSVCCHIRPRCLSHSPPQIHPLPIDLLTAQL
jgi:hypothetical protein